MVNENNRSAAQIAAAERGDKTASQWSDYLAAKGVNWAGGAPSSPVTAGQVYEAAAKGEVVSPANLPEGSGYIVREVLPSDVMTGQSISPGFAKQQPLSQPQSPQSIDYIAQMNIAARNIDERQRQQMAIQQTYKTGEQTYTPPTSEMVKTIYPQPITFITKREGQLPLVETWHIPSKTGYDPYSAAHLEKLESNREILLSSPYSLVISPFTVTSEISNKLREGMKSGTPVQAISDVVKTTLPLSSQAYQIGKAIKQKDAASATSYIPVVGSGIKSVTSFAKGDIALGLSHGSTAAVELFITKGLGKPKVMSKINIQTMSLTEKIAKVEAEISTMVRGPLRKQTYTTESRGLVSKEWQIGEISGFSSKFAAQTSKVDIFRNTAARTPYQISVSKSSIQTVSTPILETGGSKFSLGIAEYNTMTAFISRAKSLNPWKRTEPAELHGSISLAQGITKETITTTEAVGGVATIGQKGSKQSGKFYIEDLTKSKEKPKPFVKPEQPKPSGAGKGGSVVLQAATKETIPESFVKEILGKEADTLANRLASKGDLMAKGDAFLTVLTTKQAPAITSKLEIKQISTPSISEKNIQSTTKLKEITATRVTPRTTTKPKTTQNIEVKNITKLETTQKLETTPKLETLPKLQVLSKLDSLRSIPPMPQIITKPTGLYIHNLDPGNDTKNRRKTRRKILGKSYVYSEKRHKLPGRAFISALLR